MTAILSPPPMPDLAAYEQAARLPFPAVVQQLSGLLGAKLVAYLSGVRETNAVRQWGNGVSNAQAPIPQRLRLALQVAMLIAQHDSPRVVQAYGGLAAVQAGADGTPQLIRHTAADKITALTASQAITAASPP